MAKPTKNRFSFSSEEMLEPKACSEDVSALQAHLAAFGYLRGSHEPGTYCKDTQRAVRRYQRFFGLKPDGLAGPVTKTQMEAPRCGVADMHLASAAPGLSAPFVLVGCKFDSADITYAFLNDTDDLPGGREKEIVRRAFESWQDAAHLNFTEVAPGDSPDIRIAWHHGDHGDGSSFDGPSNTLAHAFFPGTCGGTHAGDLHFDEAEPWIDDPAESDSGILLFQVAVHEIGHNLGLRHSSDPGAIMFPTYAADRFELGHDDRNGVRALYGERATTGSTRKLMMSASDTGNLAKKGSQVTYEVIAPGAFDVAVDGPSDADFDLYVRNGQLPTEDSWDFRAFTTSADEKLTIPATPGDQYFIMVRSFQGKGDFTLSVEVASA